jgi:hypothetical protein
MAGEPMKVATKRVGRPVIDVLGRTKLLDDTALHDGDLGGHGHGFDLIVGHIDDRRAKALMQFFDLNAHIHAQLGVEIGQRLIEQEHLRLAHQRPPHGDALALTAGKLARTAFEQVLDLEKLGDFADTRSIRLALSTPAILSEKPMFRSTVIDG